MARVRVAVISVVVVLCAMAVVSPPASAATSISVAVDRVDCGWDPATGTLWPAVRVVRTAGATDSRVSARMVLKTGVAGDRSLGAGRVLPDGALNQSGFVDGPLSTTGVSPLTVGVPEWIRPWGARFGDGSAAGGASFAAGATFPIDVMLYDFNAGEYVTQTISCRTGGAFRLSQTSYSTSGFATGKTKVSLAGVVSKLDSAPLPSSWAKLTATCDPPVQGSQSPVVQSFCWSGTDATNDVRTQGVTGSFESGANGEPAWSGAPAGKDILLVSSYDHAAATATAATRLAVVDTSVTPRRYMFVTLQVPCTGAAPCQNGFKPLIGSHVGGLAWAGKYLYVADTKAGFKVFDLTQFYLQTGPVFSLPQVAQYTQPASCSAAVSASVKPCTLDFSYVSIANGAPYRLVSGEFDQFFDFARVVSWPLLSNGLLDLSAAGQGNQKNELVTGKDLIQFQGVAANGSKTVLTSSYGANKPGKVFRITTRSPYTNGGALPGMAAVTKAAPSGIEDLAASKTRNVVWAIAEFPGRRWVWSTSYTAAFGFG